MDLKDFHDHPDLEAGCKVPKDHVIIDRSIFLEILSEKESQSKDVISNPDLRNETIKNFIVRVYFNTNAEYEFPARDLRNARDIAARVTREGCWIINNDKTEEFFPITQIHKVKIIPLSNVVF